MIFSSYEFLAFFAAVLLLLLLDLLLEMETQFVVQFAREFIECTERRIRPFGAALQDLHTLLGREQSGEVARRIAEV